MKILQVIPAVAPRYGGPSSAIVPLCRSLMAQGLEVLLATTDADGSGRLDVPLGVSTMWEGVPTIFFARTATESFKYSFGLGRWLSRHVHEFAVVHAHAVLSYAPIAAGRACRRAGVPYVVRPLGTIDPWSLRQKRLKKQLLLALGGQRLLDGAAAIQYTSAEEKRLAEDALQLTRGIVIPLGIEPQFLNDAPVTGAARPDGPYVLALSRLHPVKNLEALITAFGAITATGRIDRNWRLVIAGNGEPAYAASLKQLAEREGVAPRVTFTGWIDGDAKHRLIAQASVYTLPSFHENFGVSLVEALAAGVPALVSREVHLAEAIRGAGAGWVVDTDEASVRAGLIDALRDADERELRGQAARGLARTFAWPGIGAQLNRLYQRLASGSPPAAGAVPVEAA